MSLKSLKPRIFKFNKGDIWDGDEQIIHYIEDVLLTKEWKDFPRIREKTYITIMVTQDKPKKSEDIKEEKWKKRQE